MDPPLPSHPISHSQETRGEGLEPVGIPGRPQGQFQWWQVVPGVIINPGRQNLGKKVGRLYPSQALGEGQETIGLGSSALSTAPSFSFPGVYQYLKAKEDHDFNPRPKDHLVTRSEVTVQSPVPA